MPYSWTCPYCDHAATILEHNVFGSDLPVETNNKIQRRLEISAIQCPNASCREFHLIVAWNNHLGNRLNHWTLLPEAEVKQFPDYIPAPILGDYREACLIRDKSPKAAATLARRCLQGMIRDFWDVKKDSLKKEIDAIDDRVAPETWRAIDAVRTIGNIGAHMEKDVNIIVDVDPDEAQLLIELIETLLSQWYVAKHDRDQQMATLIATAAEKKQARKGGPPTEQQSGEDPSTS